MEKLLVLDSNSIINRAYYGIRPLSAPDGTPTNAVYGFLNILIKLINDFKPDCILAAFDLKAPTFRHKMFDGYKANRKGMPDELAAQMPVMKDILQAMNVPVLQLEGYEADDIIGTVSRICGENGMECYIATGDRDDLQLAGNGTRVVLASTKSGQSVTEVYTEETVKEKYGVTPIEFVDLKALMGDKSDNIPGVSGIGEKTAIKLISEYSTIEKMYENIDTLNASPRIKAKLTEEKEIAFLSKKLAKIDCFVPIEPDMVAASFNAAAPDFKPELYTLLLHLGLKSVIKKLDLTPPDIKETEPVKGDFFENTEIICVTDSDALKAAVTDFGDEMAVYFDITQSTINSVGFARGKKAVYTNSMMEEIDIISAIADVMADSTVKKYTCGIKEAIVALNGKLTINNIAFDSAVAAYITDPSKSFDTDSILAQYLGVYIDNESAEAQISLLDTPQENQGKYALGIYGLYEVLSERIEKENRHTLYYEIELPLIEVLASMQIEGVTLDTNELKKFSEMLSMHITVLEQKIYSEAGEEFNINSPKQLGEILFEKLNIPGGKKTKSGYSTKADILEKLRGQYEIVDDILQYRQYQKLKSTYCESLVNLVNPKTGRIHSIFNQMGTVTGRLSSAEPNMQNIPTRTELGRELRKMFVAKEGCMLIDADYSQIELRVLAHMSKDETMIAAFKSGEDIHAVTASKILDIPIEHLTKDQRSSAKAINFGIIYGMGEYTLSQDLGISFKEAKNYMDGYFKKYSEVKKFMDTIKENAHANKYVTTIMNRIRYIPELDSNIPAMRRYGERAAMNTPVQGSAADIIKLAMVRVYNRLKEEKLKARLILQVHDELIIEAPDDEVEKVKELLKYEMENAVQLDVPLTVDMEAGRSWYDTK